MLSEYCGGSVGGALAVGSLGAARVCGGRAARDRDDLARGEMISAMRTDHVRRSLRAADAMYQGHRRSPFLPFPRGPPSAHLHLNLIPVAVPPGQPAIRPLRPNLACAP